MSNDVVSTIRKQEDVPGQRKEVNVKDYPSAIELADMLKDIQFPADKNTIVNSVVNSSTDKQVTELLGQIQDKTYNNSAEVVSATGLVKRE